VQIDRGMRSVELAGVGASEHEGHGTTEVRRSRFPGARTGS
jgi:hypothetical protein